MDIECAEMAVLCETMALSDWKIVRVLMFEWSVARCRKYDLSCRPFPVMLEALAARGWSRVYVPKECWSPT